ncbi:membrane protein insertion efficiency factor YidD [bacterium]|nr:MAG: membrane protein insertion efficiency factor YidD [bacterium]
MKNLLIFLVIIYKKIISPVLPPSCRFYPGCADYAREALETRGVLTGGAFALKRILRCQPFSKGGFDPVPQTAENIKKQQCNCN